MRIAAGVLLILAAVFNGIGGSAYALGGAVSGAAGEVVENADKLERSDGTKIEVTEESKKAAADMKATGGSWFILGVFLLVVAGLQIGGAVVLFMKKAATFALVVGGLSIAAEIWSGTTSAFGFMNIIGLVAGVLAILAAMGLKKEGGGAPAGA